MTAQHHGRRGRPWRRIRLQVLARDPYCQIRGPKCTGISTTVDHIVPLSIAPHRAHDMTNLRGACNACNFAGGARIANSKRRGMPRNGAHRARRKVVKPSGCRFHADCGGVHSRAW